MTNTELAHIVASVVAALNAQNATAQPSRKAAKTTKSSKSDRLASKDQQILRGFARKGIKGVVLMDRNDPTKDFNVRPFKGWFALGRVVKKGQHGVRGLFHISQTEALPQAEKAAPQPKAEDSVKAQQAEISRLATKFRLAKRDNQPVG